MIQGCTVPGARVYTNKPENPFQNYDVAKEIFRK